MIPSAELRQKFLDFFASKEHAVIPSAPLVPENDSSVLFNTAGMQPLVPYLMGEEHPMWRRLANSQKCLRTIDLEEVGDDSHNTFFEMLGNWSLGDYFKKESISYSWEFLTSENGLALDPKIFAVTVFEWDEQCPRDDESADIWKSLWVSENRISYLPASENWWALGPTGPCWPDTEIFYWVGDGVPADDSNVANDEDNWMEIWNNVFMQYRRDETGELHELPNRNVDTGMGFERVVSVLNGYKSIYESDVFADALRAIKEKVDGQYNERGARIAVDHIRTAVHLISDGVRPGNVDQGYILRRLIRRSIRELHRMGWDKPFVSDIALIFVEIYKDVYPNIGILKNDIVHVLQDEEASFSKTLIKWLREFQKIVLAHIKVNHPNFTKDEINIHHPDQFPGHELASFIIPGQDAFRLFDTYGFPIEMTVEIAEKEYGFSVDTEWFEKAFKAHQEKSRTASAGKFKWGLADNDPQTLKLHTATHLLLAWLKHFLWDHVHQAGSNITPERLRFDFTHPEKVTRDILDEIEVWVNDIIQKPCTMTCTIMSKDQAQSEWVEGSFWDKYPDEVKVYTLQDTDGTIYSRELCGWPHVESTVDMGVFKIKKEESSSRGVRRIKAVLV